MFIQVLNTRMASTSTKIYAQAIGRRKSAIASARLVSGSGKITVNGKPADKYFPGVTAAIRYAQPFSILSLTKYDASIVVHGGGLHGQLDAAVLAISNALVKLKSDYKPALRQQGLMTRDSRARQRRMIGTGGKARRKKQSPKR